MAPKTKASASVAAARQSKDRSAREVLELIADLLVEWRGTMPNAVRIRAEAVVDKIAELRGAS